MKVVRRVRPRGIVVALLVLLVGVVGAGSAVASDGSSTSASTSSSDRSTDLRIGFVDDIDFQANIFAAYDATPYFIFTEVYDLLLNYK